MDYFVMYIGLLLLVMCLRVFTLVRKMQWSASGILLALLMGLTGTELFVVSLWSLGGRV